MASIFQSVISIYYKYVEETVDPRVKNWLFLTSPFYIIAIIAFYNYFIRKLGPQWMKNREPYNVDMFMVIHNVIQILLNGWFVFVAFRDVWLPFQYSLVCENVDHSYDPLALHIAHYAWMFFISKILDLFDTVFMVLRKKGQQMTFLHVYHHSGMIFATWISARYLPGGHGVLFGTVNSFVHFVMYSYYLITTLYPDYKKNIWWKRYITELQMWQFVITTFHACLALFNTNCNYPKPLLLFFIPQDMFMLVLFWNFYQKAYSKDRLKKLQQQDGQASFHEFKISD